MRALCLTIVLVSVLLASPAFGGDKKKIIVPPGTKPGGNYSQGILIDDTLYIFPVREAKTQPVRFPASSKPK